jgi:Rhodopirellula transposase DDE domain
VAELESGEAPLGRARRRGGGRKRVADLDPGLVPALLALVEPDERGDPASPLRWTTKSTRKLAVQLTRQGHTVSADTVGDLLRAEGFSLQGNAKTIEGRQHPDRDGQFRYINEEATAYQAAGDPVISVDTKKKELVGRYANGGAEWRPAGEPERVNTHDFPDAELGKAIPYGIYDVAANAGWVNVGTDHDTAAFAVESIRRWWNAAGRAAYPDARRLLITADAGGSNSYRTRAWKSELAALAVETGLAVTVCHFPPGTSKWNTIEHRLFSAITMNWRGRPLTSHQVIINTIAATTTATGLTVHAELDPGAYEVGVKISDAQMAGLPLDRHHWHGDWNYTLRPQHPTPQPAQPAPRPPARDGTRAHWAHPALTGMTTTAWDQLIQALTTPYQTQRDIRLYLHRGGPPTRKPAGGHPHTLTLADKVLITVLRQRYRTPQPVLAELFGVATRTIATAEHHILPLLHQHGHTTEPADTPLKTHADLTAHATAHGIDLTPKPAS